MLNVPINLCFELNIESVKNVLKVAYKSMKV